jgi:hypothetical protein
MLVGRANRRRALRASTWMAAVGCMLVGVTACDIFAPGPTFEGIPSLGNVTLHIENRSGFGISAEVLYLSGDTLVRRTVRQLAASGVESVEEVIPTNADSIIAVARLAESTATPNGMAAGQILQLANYKRGVDYFGDTTLSFIIAAPPSGDPIPGCAGCPIFGDLNDDKVVDELDIPLFIEVVFGINRDAAARLKSDFNLDGEVNGLDVQGFVACLIGK